MAIDHTAPPDVQRFCDPYCYPPLNPAGICPVFCVIICLNACKTIIPQITLPPDVSSPPPPPPWSRPPDLHYKLSLALIIVASIIATAFFFLTCYTLYKLYSCWRRRPARVRVTSRRYDSDRTHFEDLGPVIDNPIWYIRTVGLQPSVINSIPVVKYSKLDGLIDGTDCSVCLTEFEEDETLRLLPKCNHAFHLPCIDTWLRSHTNCPLCRAAVIDTDTTLIPSEEVIVHNSSMVESNPVETEGSELRLGIDEHQIGMDPVRRSVSMDALSASRVCNRVLGDEKEQDQNYGIVVSKRVVINQSLLRLVGSSSLQTGSSCSSVKRSVSCSAKVFQERN